MGRKPVRAMGDETTHVHFLETDTGDWIGMYVNGHLVLEGHSIDVVAAVSELPDVEVTTAECDVEDLAPYGYRCPKELQDEKVLPHNAG